MKRRMLTLFALLPVLAALLCACSGEKTAGGGMLLYFVPTEADGETALVGEKCALSAGEATVDSLMAALLAGPADERLCSPIPRGVELLRWSLEDTCLTVDLSERYGGLTDVGLTLADYAITLTLCQLEGVESVRILADGKPVMGRALQELRPGDLVLSGAPETE